MRTLNAHKWLAIASAALFAVAGACMLLAAHGCAGLP